VAYHLANYVQPRNWLAHQRARLSLEWLRLDTAVRRWFLARADGVVSVSESTLEIHRQAGLRLGSSARVIYNLPPAAEPVTADDLAALRKQFSLDGGPIVLFAGRLSPGKGVPDLLSATPYVAARVPGVQVVLAGPGNIATTDPQVRSLGSIPHEAVMGLHHLADLVVVPSVWPEPLSRVILEAMATGRPVVGTAVGGTPEMISHGENGLLVPRNDPRQLAEAIVAILNDHQLRTRMGIASRHIVDECFGSARSLDQLVDFYESLGAQR
jgi:glycosyltransferase involved in cell wall biosynthesis